MLILLLSLLLSLLLRWLRGSCVFAANLLSLLSVYATRLSAFLSSDPA